MRNKAVLYVVLLSVSLVVVAQVRPAASRASSKSTSNAKPVAAASAIDPQHIRAHVKFLSNDLLEGRGTGQRGGDLAAEYIATQFELYGLKPAGDNGGYLQKVPMVGITTEPSTTLSYVAADKTTNLRLSDDAVATDETQNPTSDVDADVVFVGYGVDAPEYQWNDYKDADVKGKVLLMLVNEPPSDDPAFFKGKALTYYGRWTYKYEEAARKGAVGAIIIHKSDMASYDWDVVKNSWAGERSFLANDGRPKLKLTSWVQLDVARKMIGPGKDLDVLMKDAQSRDFKPVPLQVRVRAHMVSKVRRFDSSNVLALLPGADAKLKSEAVVYSAHYDHLGIHAGQTGDNIYNGAVDNATGCGVLLEMARAFTSSSQRPKRSIFFVAVTAEEQGLRGSEFLGQHPPIAAGNISLGLNFDGLAPNGLPEEVDVSGSERTTFYTVVQATAKEFGVQIKPDSNPSAGFYYRSDHFSLARVGIPAFSVNEGMKFQGHPVEWGIQKEREYNDQRYHQPSDEFQADWDFSGLAQMARFGVALGWKAANQPQQVAWLPGDEFEATRKASLASSTKDGQ